MTIPKLIRERRQAMGLTQKALGEKCGYGPQSGERIIQHWEKGSRPIPLARMRDLAAALGIQVEDLIPGK